ncbi:MAG TPA: TonB-dependent receptor, partial [Thermoanaerobaculia bacterium]|nr:TonB-dependent receptor [Thermoanaerobaculia bacterium]
MRRFLAAAAIAAVALRAAAHPYAGRALTDVIAQMQQRGLNVVYSSDLVKPEMRVAAEPRAASARAALDEMLAPFALITRRGPGGAILIVRAARREPPPPSKPAIDAAPTPMNLPVSLAHIVVTASDYAVLGSAPEQRQFLTRDEVNRTAHLGDDVFRALNRLPGAAATDFSAAFDVRGGRPDEILVLLDGLEIADPFHIRYFQNAISVVDSEAIGSLDYLSGGFPVEYGGRMSAVVDMSTVSASERRTYAGASFTTARLVTQGTFDGDRGEWLVSARRGYFDLLLDLFYSDVSLRPRYDDVIARLQYRVGERSVLSGDVLTAGDRISYDRQGDLLHGRYDDRYVWLNLRTSWSPRLSSQIVASHAGVRQTKTGGFDVLNAFATVADRRAFGITGLKHDWTLDRSDLGHYVKFGGDAKRYAADYDYAGHAINRDTLLAFSGTPAVRDHTVSISPRGTSLAMYAADRVQVAKPLAVEAGLRAERESWNAGDAAVAPRLNVVWTPGPHTAVRASWGVFRQAQRPDELAAQDGDTTFYPAEVARQSEIGVEQRVRGGVTLRLTGYRKTVAHVRPRYENLFERDEFFPEAKYDRIRVAPDAAESRGVELSIKDDSRRALTWWASVVRSSAVDRFAGHDVPRNWDQPFAASFVVNYRVAAWNVNVAGLMHSGWPTTGVTASVVRDGNTVSILPRLGERNRERLPDYMRFDLRVMH